MRYVIGDVADDLVMTYDGGTDKWIAAGTVGTCDGSLFTLSCLDGVWTLTVDGTPYTADDGGLCFPFLQFFFGVDLTACGFDVGAIINIAA
jgi:hypothetical protein